MSYELLKAIENNNIAEVQKILSVNPKLINSNVINLARPIEFAIVYDKLEIFEYLITIGANIDFTPDNGFSLLHRAAANKNPKFTEILLLKGLKVDCLDNENRTPLMIAASMGNLDTYKTLLSNGADFKLKDLENNTLLHFAAEGCNKDIIQILIDEKFDVNAKNKYEATPLMIVADHGKNDKKPAFDLLIANGANQELTNCYGYSLIHFAASGGNVEIIKSVLQKQSDLLNKKTPNSETPIFFAVYNNRIEAVKTLIEAKADLGFKNQYNQTLLHCAASKNLPDITELLIQNGLNINVKDDEGLTPTMIAVKRESYKSLSVLLKNGAKLDINYRKVLFRTAIASLISITATAAVIAAVSAPFWILAIVLPVILASAFTAFHFWENRININAIEMAKDFEAKKETNKTKDKSAKVEAAPLAASMRAKVESQEQNSQSKVTPTP